MLALRRFSLFGQQQLCVFRCLAQPATRSKGKRGAKDLSYDFDTEVVKMLDSVEKSVEELLPLNKEFSVSRIGPDQLEISTVKGSYEFHTTDKSKVGAMLDLYKGQSDRVLTAVSRASGYHHYDFDPEERVWLSVRDGHDLRGIFTRDISKACIGCPKFD